MNFVWPISTVCAGIILDWTLMKTKSFLITSFVGAHLWVALVWAYNYIPLAPFLQPAHFMRGASLAVAGGCTNPRVVFRIALVSVRMKQKSRWR